MPLNHRMGPSGLIAEFAVLLAREPGLARRLLAWHVDDGTGRCAGCRDQRPPTWPCVLAGLTARATERAERGLGASRSA